MTDSRTITLRFTVDIEMTATGNVIDLDRVCDAVSGKLEAALEGFCAGRRVAVSPGCATLTIPVRLEATPFQDELSELDRRWKKWSDDRQAACVREVSVCGDKMGWPT